jgi:leucyl/phenylalanyl-tRNA--protein transferase
MYLHFLDSLQPDQAFPALDTALKEPDGLLAVGGCLTPKRLINAYRHGIFPWFNPGEPILWWSPDPRLVLFPEKLKVSRSLKKTLRHQRFYTTYNQSFASVVQACAAPRDEHGGTWITNSMQEAYWALHQRGVAHSIEVWQEGELVGGLYGVAIGRVFFGESMFHRVTDASKVAFAGLVGHLIEWGYELVDCQVSSGHLLSLGAENIPRAKFIELLDRYCEQLPASGAWK